MIDPKLKTLLSVVKEGSFTRAAEVLTLSQPAVSYHIRQDVYKRQMWTTS